MDQARVCGTVDTDQAGNVPEKRHAIAYAACKRTTDIPISVLGRSLSFAYHDEWGVRKLYGGSSGKAVPTPGATAGTCPWPIVPGGCQITLQADSAVGCSNASPLPNPALMWNFACHSAAGPLPWAHGIGDPRRPLDHRGELRHLQGHYRRPLQYLQSSCDPTHFCCLVKRSKGAIL